MHAFTPMAALEGDETLADRRDARTFARAMLLLGRPVSPEANTLVSTIVDTVVVPFRASMGQARPSMLPHYRKIVGCLLSDMLMACSSGRWSKLRTSNEAICSYPGGATAFKTARSALQAAGLTDELPGFIRKYELFGQEQQRAATTSFRPTARLVETAAEHGVELDSLGLHFAAPAPAPPPAAAIVEARASRASKGDKAVQVQIEPGDRKAATIIDRMQRLNAHLMEPGRVKGITFAGLRRVFSNADRRGFDWQWGGRFYSLPQADSYESMEGGSASRAKVLRLDGEEVAEVDLSAAHLTILHGLLGKALDGTSDPYAFAGLEREAVKDWVKFALGASDPSIGGNRYAKARAACLERYPALEGLAFHGISTHDLQFHEAEIMLKAMEELRDRHGIGFLPVHDALIVPRSTRDLAASVLASAVHSYFKEILGLPGGVVARVHCGV